MQVTTCMNFEKTYAPTEVEKLAALMCPEEVTVSVSMCVEIYMCAYVEKKNSVRPCGEK